jgi:monoamine oxidase
MPQRDQQMEQAKYFEDYQVGDSRTTSGRTITETDFVVHAGHTGDFFPHHMDAEFMKTQPFGQRIAHGTMVFSIGVGLTASVINPLAFSYGYDRLRFIKPVFIGDTIRTRVTISTKEDDPKRANHGRVMERTEVINQKGDVVLAADHIYIVERRPAG